VWIGGLPEIKEAGKRKDVSKKLFEQLKTSTECKFAEVWPKGVGVACFKTEDDAQAAIAALDGSEFEGNVLEVSAWEKKQK